MGAKIANFLFPTKANNYHPEVMRFRYLVGIGVFLFLLRVFLGVIPVQSAAVDSETLMRLINQERNQRNLTTLLAHNSLVQAAQTKSQDMIDRDYFAHQDPDGNFIWPVIISSGYPSYKILGENLAIDFSTSEGMVKAWIDSPTHRDNLLHPDFVHQGLVAVFGDWSGRYTNLTTSLFGTPMAFSSPQSSQPEQEAPPPQQPEPAPEVKSGDEPVPQSEPAPEPEPEPEPAEPLTGPDKNIGFAPPQTPSVPDDPLAGVNLIRIVFIVFGLGFLTLLTVDSVIIYRKEAKLARSHPSYHLFLFVLLVLIFTLVWFWR